MLALRALGTAPGDRVIVPANTFFATAEAVSLAGAEPALVDCDRATRTISVEAVERGAARRRRRGRDRRPPVRPPGRRRRARRGRGTATARGSIEDACQAHLARARGVRAGGLGRIACFSFYPSKNLGATGEGGAVTTNDAELAAAVRELRHHGQRRIPPPRARSAATRGWAS